MAERGGVDNDSRSKLKDRAKLQENAMEESESREKNQNPETITEVKSKIKDKNAEPAAEESVGALKGLKVGTVQSSSNKISKFSKHKRNKSAKNEISDNQEISLEDKITENAENEDLLSQNSESESKNQTEIQTTLSKKSLTQIKSSVKGPKKATIPADEENKENAPFKQINKADRKLTNESLSTFVISHDIEVQKNQATSIPSNIAQDAQDNLSRSPSQRQITERGNYLNNVAPVPEEDTKENEKKNANQKSDSK